MIEFKVSAPGKIILFGEHAVVYGKTAVAASVDLRTTLEFAEQPGQMNCITILMPALKLSLDVPLAPLQDYFFKSTSPGCSRRPDELYSHIEKFIELIDVKSSREKLSLQALFYLLVSICQEEEGLTLGPFKVHVKTQLSIGAGLGSSASFAVCLAAAFVLWNQAQRQGNFQLDNATLEKISKYAFNCEKIMHGSPSGIDNSVCTFGSIVEFRKDKCLNVISNVHKMKALLVDTKVQRSTKVLVKKLADLKEAYPDIYLPILESIDALSRESLTIIKRMGSNAQISPQLRADYQQLMVKFHLNQSIFSSQ